ncbi:hypothetical protein [Natronolimnobius sp. AArcel1]|uniref:hypothetical protein n=1 Tax=Natronolimnobius sp. AArcel1 TaxID=1679093 RepID=UPI0019D06FD2|nr:hypothetical protein [Natronolimnobius sp. AArcel1]
MPSDGAEHVEWWEKASNNVEKWGLQDVPTLLLAMQEEMGELEQAHLEARDEDGDPERVGDELADLAALCFQLQWALNYRSLGTDTDQPHSQSENSTRREGGEQGR